MQKHTHKLTPDGNYNVLLAGGTCSSGSNGCNTGEQQINNTGTQTSGRIGTVTHGKQKGVKFIIKVL